MFDFITKTAAGVALALGLWAAPAEAARIDLADRLLRATPLISFTDVGATGFLLAPAIPPSTPPLAFIGFDNGATAPSFSGDVLDPFGLADIAVNIFTPSLTGAANLTPSEIGFDPGGTIVDLLLDVTGGTGDFAGLVGQQLFATVEGPIALFASDLADLDPLDPSAFALGEGFDVSFSTVAPIPLPAGGLLLLGGLGGLALLRRRKRA